MLYNHLSQGGGGSGVWLVGKSTGLKNIRILISPVTIGYCIIYSIGNLIVKRLQNLDACAYIWYQNLTSIHSQNMIRVFNLRILHCQVFNAIHGKVSNIHVHGLMHELKYKRFLLSEKKFKLRSLCIFDM